MAKITVTSETDIFGRDYLLIQKTRGKLTQTEVYEALQSYGMAPLVSVLPIITRDELDESLYDTGDVWRVYDYEELEKTSKERNMPIQQKGNACPICMSEVSQDWYFCPYCGQAFDRKT